MQISFSDPNAFHQEHLDLIPPVFFEDIGRLGGRVSLVYDFEARASCPHPNTFVGLHLACWIDQVMNRLVA
ncbi:hypothetical protein CEXT_588831 [Caerostris extrusa]|uniref:Uncharacterized protein n=1 Tax=Caerostris extrusa TaxID=172846 RepID=A0AAV4TQ77_CAEEX|nr:hypothetical protein CEXT_588831 [Caerostris extrusa]